jgi:inner membrane protein
MLIAHLPAGYITARAAGQRDGPLLWAALIGSVFPDFDMIWFLFIDQGAIHHHKYWVHAPGFWLILGAILVPFLAKPARNVGLMFLAAIFIHIVLDTLAGGIMWLWPLSDHLYTFATVPATQANWVLSFMVHWTFLLEIGVIGVAAVLFLNRKATL